ncbi:MAG: hypothetical protein IT230_12615 [Flavobacteriales bacterium]|nr:hypothetical protein [Flavobacteriales bacterium]
MIAHLLHHQIDQAVWDRRLAACVNGSWYGTSSALNAAAPGWDALVDEATGAQMPLPWRRKYGIRYLFQPFLLQHLGPYSPLRGSEQELAERFLHAVPPAFRYADIQLQVAAVAPSAPWRVEQRSNHVLRLAGSLQQLRAAYSDNHRRSLKKFMRSGLVVEKCADGAEVCAVLTGSEQFKQWGIDAAGQLALERVLTFTEQSGAGFGRIVRGPHGPHAVGWFVRHGQRILFLKGLGTAGGREIRAMHALIDHVVEEFAGSDLELDFAGGQDPQLARFYAGFGAGKQEYVRALMNRLPPVVRLLKH